MYLDFLTIFYFSFQAPFETRNPTLHFDAHQIDDLTQKFPHIYLCQKLGSNFVNLICIFAYIVFENSISKKILSTKDLVKYNKNWNLITYKYAKVYFIDIDIRKNEINLFLPLGD